MPDCIFLRLTNFTKRGRMRGRREGERVLDQMMEGGKRNLNICECPRILPETIHLELLFFIFCLKCNCMNKVLNLCQLPIRMITKERTFSPLLSVKFTCPFLCSKQITARRKLELPFGCHGNLDQMMCAFF